MNPDVGSDIAQIMSLHGATASRILDVIALKIEERYTQPALANLSVKELKDRLTEKLAEEFSH